VRGADQDQTALSTIASPDASASGFSAASLARRLAPYKRPSHWRAAVEILITIVPLAGLLALSWASLSQHNWWGLLLVPVAAAFLMRLFMIQHDCGHGAFVPGQRLNDWLGRALGVLTLTPYDYWRRAHAIHHATSGALDRRRIGGIDTLTVDEYRALSPWRQLGYRLYRHPMVMFGLGPAFVFLIQHRLPVGMMKDGWRPWVSTMATNLCAAGLVVGLAMALGVAPFLLIYIPVVTLAASMGVWLFFVQHQFEDTYWARDDTWEFHDAAFHGSSHYDLPAPLRWVTANIGVHHVHHLSSRIPYYRLGDVMRDEPGLRAAGRLTMMRSLSCVPLALWDDARGCLVSFRQANEDARAEPGLA
jgi:omega-6 fatty acid desaturase (delta-12 desaturase)